MELIVVVVGLCGLVALALRYGHDSRDVLRSEEQRLAEFGFTWSGKPRGWQPSLRPATGRKPAAALRHLLAMALNGLADWLYPVGLSREA
jgi:hypothetical protein